MMDSELLNYELLIYTYYNSAEKPKAKGLIEEKLLEDLVTKK